MKFHNFNTAIAKEYGMAEAVFINNLQHWIEKNKANDKHFYDGRWWTYNSIPAFAQIFDYLSPPQIKRLVKRLVDKGVIVIGNYNKSPYDHTRWYAFKDQERFLFDQESSISRNRPVDETQGNHRSDEIVPSLTDKNTDKNTNDIYRVFSKNAHTHRLPLNNEIEEGKNCANKAIMGEDVVKSMDSASNDDCCIIYNMKINDLDANIQTQNSEKNNTILKKDFDTTADAAKANKKAKTKASTLAEDWALPDEWKQWALDASGWSSEFVENQADKFHDHHLSKGTKSVSWLASWRYWCRNSAEYKGVSLKTKQQIKAAVQKNKQFNPQASVGHIPSELKNEWQAVQAELKERVGDAKFKSWLEPLSPIYPFHENKLTIKAPTRFTKDHVSQHFYEDMKRLCVKALGVRDVEFVFKTAL